MVLFDIFALCSINFAMNGGFVLTLQSTIVNNEGQLQYSNNFKDENSDPQVLRVNL